MSEKLGLGKIIKGEQHRDAIHVAVVPVYAAQKIEPGSRIKLVNGLAQPAQSDTIGVADPFLKEPVFQGDRFWLFLYPGSITSLRHDWTHPELPHGVEIPAIISPTSDEEKELHKIADVLDITYEELMYGAKNYLDHGDYMCDGGKFEGVGLPDNFWDLYQIVTKKQVPKAKQGHFFTCSC